MWFFVIFLAIVPVDPNSPIHSERSFFAAEFATEAECMRESARVQRAILGATRSPTLEELGYHGPGAPLEAVGVMCQRSSAPAPANALAL